jgi:ABC-type nitrate/sulfonate/bicarbonate transport system substrate-binding protein
MRAADSTEGISCRRVRRVLIVAMSLLLAAACGSSSPARQLRDATLVLDFTPNAVHAGIYAATARHYDTAQRVRLHVVVPSASTDSIKLLETARANFAILDIHDLAIARERGADIVGIMAIVERPLSSVLAAPRITSPRALYAQPVGITGVPSDTAVLDSVVTGAGGNPRRLKTVTIGFNAVPDLLAGRVAAATAFWNDEGITLERSRPGFHAFRVDSYGAPPYPELVLCATRASLRRDPGLARSVARALVAGYGFTLAHPAVSAAELERLVPGLDPALVRAQLGALLPAFRGPSGRVGELDPATLERWAAWEVRFGIVARRPDVAATFDRAIIRP